MSVIIMLGAEMDPARSNSEGWLSKLRHGLDWELRYICERKKA
jgi:hypothetical protein